MLTLCEAHLGPRGFRAIDVDCHVGPRSIVRIFIERMAQEAEASALPTLDDCAEASRTIGTVLDGAEDLIPGGYDLEVSSPGLDRRLRLRSDFQSVVGEQVKLKLTESLEGKGANVTGRLLKVSDDNVTVEVSGEERTVPFDKIKRANRVWVFNK